ncbi:hypothetical protein B0G93_11015 [Bacillus sp. V-88]|nr:hypothetical protein B0G93_11015 [Bacillus sp. V-88]SLK23110.1 hypothetical protein SAMN06295884_11015 [Bacillus sp. V-88]
MTYRFNVLTQEQAENIAFTWHYEGDYSFYDMKADPEDLDEFLNPEERGDTTFAVSKDKELVAFFSISKIADGIFDIGLGMRPDLTGKGNGIEFLRAGMNYVQS